MNFKKLMAVSLLILSSSLQAQDHIGWGNPGNSRNPGRDPWEDRREERREDARDIELHLNQYFQGQTRLDLLQDYYIRSQLQGKRLREVIITASTDAGRGQARVLTNGQSLEMAQTVARHMASYTFRIDPFTNLRSLELEMQGRFFVEKVVFVTARDQEQPRVEVVRQQLNESIQGEGGLHLFRMFNLGMERRGQEIRRVTVLARSQRGHGQAQLHINEFSNGLPQTIGMSSTRLTFELSPGQKIGQDIQSLRLFFRGNVIVEEVSIEIEKGSNRPGPGPGPLPGERRIEQVINQRIYDTSGVNLTALMRIERRHEERIVDSVELVLRASDYGARLKLCQEVPGQYQAINCGNITTLSPGAQVVRLTSVNFAKLSELSLSVRMGMIDIERIIINLR